MKQKCEMLLAEILDSISVYFISGNICFLIGS